MRRCVRRCVRRRGAHGREREQCREQKAERRVTMQRVIEDAMWGGMPVVLVNKRGVFCVLCGACKEE